MYTFKILQFYMSIIYLNKTEIKKIEKKERKNMKRNDKQDKRNHRFIPPVRIHIHQALC